MSTVVIVIAIIGLFAWYAVTLGVLWIKGRRSAPVARPVIMKPTTSLTTPPVSPETPRKIPPRPPPPQRRGIRKDDTIVCTDVSGSMPEPPRRPKHSEPPGKAVFEDVLTRIMLARQKVFASEFAQKADCQLAIDDALRCYNLAVLAARTDNMVQAFALLQRARNAAAYASANSPPLRIESRGHGGQC